MAKIVYRRAASNLKRVLALGGAKNHLIVLPDANVDMTASDVASSMTGCAGQRCMAASAMVGVGDVDVGATHLLVGAATIVLVLAAHNIVVGGEHKHEAQKPKTINLNEFK